jgi:hypothetical protein
MSLSNVFSPEAHIPALLKKYLFASDNVVSDITVAETK